MKSKILMIFTCLCFSVMLVVSSAFALWEFASFRSELPNNPIVDNVKENYEMHSASFQTPKETYTIYVFPSTIYLQKYKNYLDDPNSNRLPEDLYGYVEYTVDDEGNINKTPTLNGRGGDGGEITLGNGQTVDRPRFLLNSYLADVSSNSHYISSANSGSSNSFYTSYKNQTLWNNYNYYIGDPDLDTNSRYLINTDSNEDSAEKHGYRNLHLYDRFGYWRDTKSGNGRYLPIKITIDFENITISDFSKIITEPMADIGDRSSYFNYVFSCWTYVSFENNSYSLPFEPLSYSPYNNLDIAAFSPVFLDNYFDVTQSLDKFAHVEKTDDNKEEKVIRLFPKFSNGKNYESENRDTAFVDGGGDAMKIMNASLDTNSNGVVDYNNSNVLPLGERERYFTFSESYGTYNNVGNTCIGVITNFHISNNISDTYRISIAYTAGTVKWNSGWSVIYNLTPTIFQNITNTYGEGDYTIYVVIGNYSGSGNIDGNRSFANIWKDLVNGSNFNFSSNSMVNPLLRHELLELSSISSYLGEVSSFRANEATYTNRRFMIAMEKMHDARLVPNVSENNSNETANQTKYNSSKFSFTQEPNTVTNVTNNRDIDVTYKYVVSRVNLAEYLETLKNANEDLKEMKDSDFKFQIRYDAKYDATYDFDFSGNYPNTVGGNVKAGEVTYHPMDTFFNLVKSTNSNTQTYFTLDADQSPGTYDILMLLYNDTANNKKTFYCYAYRHTETFVKVYENKITDLDAQGFVVEEPTSSNHLLFWATYEVWDFATGNPLDVSRDVYSSLVNAENEFYSPDNVSKALDVIMKSYLDDKYGDAVSYENYVLRDNVSDLIVAWFDSDGTMHANTDFKIRKNYILYVDEVINSEVIAS